MSVASPTSSATVLPPLASNRAKTKAAMGISAGAEDSKYHAKYKDLKRKVKELEADNDRLLFKTLQAKRSVQRMKLERAILYERLAAVPPSPEMAKESIPLPSAQDIPPTPLEPPPPRIPSEPSGQRNEPMDVDGPRAFQNATSISAPVPSEARRPAPVANVLPPIKDVRSSAGYEGPRQLPTLPPVQDFEGSPRAHSHGSPPSGPMSHPSPHEMHFERRSSAPRNHFYNSAPRYRPVYMVHDDRPGVREMIAHPLDGHRERQAERERNRKRPLDFSQFDRPPELDRPPRRYEHNGEPHHRVQPHPPPPHHGENVPRSSSTRVHNHQRLGPGVHLNQSPKDHPFPVADVIETNEQTYTSKTWHPPVEASRSQQAHPISHPPPRQRPTETRQRSFEQPRERMDYPEHPPPPRHRWSGGDTPNSSGSGSGSNIAADMPPRPDSRGYYDSEPPRTFRLRPVNPEDQDHPMDDGRHPREHFEHGYSDHSFQSVEFNRAPQSKKRQRTERRPMSVEEMPYMSGDPHFNMPPGTEYGGPVSPDPHYPEGMRGPRTRRRSDK